MSIVEDFDDAGLVHRRPALVIDDVPYCASYERKHGSQVWRLNASAIVAVETATISDVDEEFRHRGSRARKRATGYTLHVHL